MTEVVKETVVEDVSKDTRNSMNRVIALNSMVEELNEEKKTLDFGADFTKQFGISEDFDLNEIEKYIAADPGLVLKPVKQWTFEDVEKYFTVDGELIDIDVPTTTTVERKKEFFLNLAMLLYENSLSRKEIDRLTDEYLKETAEIMEELESYSMDITPDGPSDVSLTIVNMIDEKLSSLEGVDGDEAAHDIKILEESRDIFLNGHKLEKLLAFIKSKTLKQIRNNIKKNSLSLSKKFQEIVMNNDLIISARTWQEKGINLELDLYPSTDIKYSVPNLFVFTMVYYITSIKDTNEQLVTTEQMMNDIIYLMDPEVFDSGSPSHDRSVALITAIDKVLDVMVEKVGGDLELYKSSFSQPTK